MPLTANNYSHETVRHCGHHKPMFVLFLSESICLGHNLFYPKLFWSWNEVKGMSPGPYGKLLTNDRYIFTKIPKCLFGHTAFFVRNKNMGRFFSPSFLKGNRRITCYYDYPTVTMHKLHRCILFSFSAIFPCSPQPCQNRRVTCFCAATHQLRSTNLKYDLKDVVPFFSTISS